MSLCKWSNEDCNSDGECCSQRCVQVHPGTNARCMKTSMGGPCLYNFHCGYRYVGNRWCRLYSKVLNIMLLIFQTSFMEFIFVDMYALIKPIIQMSDSLVFCELSKPQNLPI